MQDFEKLMEGRGRDLIIRIAASRGVDLSPSLVDLINCMLQPDAQKRITIEGVARHPWMMESNEEETESSGFDAYGE